MNNVFYKSRLILWVLLVTLPTVLFAQDPDDPNQDPNYGVNDNNVPFDGGVSLLIAAGIGYGLKKANDKRKAEEI